MSSAAELGALARSRVLVVEDEYFLADDIMRALQGLGAEVVGPVPTRDKALALLASSESIDAAVLDINLQGEAVFPVADALIERGIPFVFATGYDQSAVPAAYDGVRRWEKPFEPAELAKALPGLLHSS
jgi:CheY-like chemotaxis protein